ncbi:MAG: S8 family peptidase [Methylobacter sp.]|uniref:S8 family peptidase n=1 Tax=Methylobacter sp. TaxID=2051955 RepID=UPI002731F551|nr:S8 family peptidase [Methylobacter sp.]MDP1665045.1 S8 family peptidase [Methylobacter sp.]
MTKKKPPIDPNSDAAADTAKNPRKPQFTPETLDSTVIAIPLLDKLKEEQEKLRKDPEHKPESFPVIIDLNLEFPEGRDKAGKQVINTIEAIIKDYGKDRNRHEAVNYEKTLYSTQYVFASLGGDVIRELVKRDSSTGNRPGLGAIFHIWPDFKIESLINKSIRTVKADAAQTSFSAFGENIVWAVLDSGINASHPHFKYYENLNLKPPLAHTDFTRLGAANPDDATAMHDAFGHGTHVAGIIAGALKLTTEYKKKTGVKEIRANSRQRDEHGEISYNEIKIDAISGMAPKCKLLSLKVLDEHGGGLASNIIAAIGMIQELNGHGRRLLIHGVNLSVGYDFEPEWFACGQSPLCVEVNRLVRSGVVVVVAAGNTGYGVAQSQFRGVISAGMDLTINDPANADLAITVGSTHKDMPHVYGVSYFSSKGPTGDGRAKPDLVAPGEKILSCAAGTRLEEMQSAGHDCDYLELSGTSMAAPHVSGVIAAFLSIRQEYIGYPEKVKEIFLSTATDLKRDRYFQGYGLVDLMRAVQSV